MGGIRYGRRYCVIDDGVHVEGGVARTNIGRGIEAALPIDRGAGWWAVFAFVLLMITREGMETALGTVNAGDGNPVRRHCLQAPCWAAGAALIAWLCALRPSRESARFFRSPQSFSADLLRNW